MSGEFPDSGLPNVPVDPIEPVEHRRSPLLRLDTLALLVLLFLVFASRSGALQRVWDMITGNNIEVSGQPVPAAQPKLSEHNAEWLETRPPQEQAEYLLSAAINHDVGATTEIAKKVDAWHGHLKRTKNWQSLEMTALYSNDLRVRAAAIEINLAVNQLAKTQETVDQLIASGEKTPGNRPWNAWELGMLANRGIETQRIHDLLATYIHDPDEQTRFWAVEGLANIGTDETIKDFLDVLHYESSANVRERAGCSLSKSGMLTREQRMKAVPGLLQLTDDSSLDPTTRNWVYQALREITDEGLPSDAAAWRNWYAEHGEEKVRKFREQNQVNVLGNN
jgi:hypothetical protein